MVTGAIQKLALGFNGCLCVHQILQCLILKKENSCNSCGLHIFLHETSEQLCINVSKDSSLCHFTLNSVYEHQDKREALHGLYLLFYLAFLSRLIHKWVSFHNVTKLPKFTTFHLTAIKRCGALSVTLFHV